MHKSANSVNIGGRIIGFGLLDSGENDEHNSGGLVGILTIFVMQNDFFSMGRHHLTDYGGDILIYADWAPPHAINLRVLFS